LEVEKIKKAIVELDEVTVKNLVEQMLKEGIAPEEILKKGLIAGMKEVGELFARKDYFVPEVLLASEAFYAGFNIVQPLIKVSQFNFQKAKIAIGVVEGDIHDIGKNIVKVMFEASGYKVVDLGRDVPTQKFIKAIENEKPQILALSSLMTTTMMHMEEIITILEEKNLRKDVKVIVGGAPVNEDFAKKIGADGYGEDAFAALKVVERLT